MALYAIADLHLSGFKSKPMDIFGENWKNHSDKIKINWSNIVENDDTVLIAGDISWAINYDEVDCDLRFVENLPGKKIFVKGNHDYWWEGISRLNGQYKNMKFLQNISESYKNIAICGTRGWLPPSDDKFTNDDIKIYKREIIRAELSLSNTIGKSFDEVVFVMHYPPAYEDFRDTEFTELFKKYNVKKVVYGHLHGEKNFEMGISGEHNGIEYMLVSSDYIDFTPKKIIEC